MDHFLSILTGICGGAILLLIPKTRTHILWVVIITLIIVIAIELFSLSPYSIKFERDGNQFTEVQKVAKIEEPLNSTNISSTESQKKPIVKIQQENPTHVSQLKSGNQANLQRSSIESDNGFVNEVQHEGYLTIRVLENKQPIPFVNYWVSCAKDKQTEPNDKKVLSQEIFIGDYNGTAFINCKINNERWLLDMFTTELKMPNCNIEINGKIIPDNYIIKSQNKESANYKIELKKIN